MMLSKILTAPTHELGRFARFIVFQIRLWPQCVKLLGRNHASRQAAALSYHTIFGLVPLAIVMLLIFQSIHAFDDIGLTIKEFVYEQTNINKLEYPGGSEGTEKVAFTEKIDQIERCEEWPIRKRTMCSIRTMG